MFKQPASVCGLIQLGVPQKIISYFAFALSFGQWKNFMAPCLLLAVAKISASTATPVGLNQRSLYEDGRSDCEAVQAGRSQRGADQSGNTRDDRRRSQRFRTPERPYGTVSRGRILGRF